MTFAFVIISIEEERECVT